MSNRGKVALVGFGTFSVTKRPARIGRNPQTGKEIKTAAISADKKAATAKAESNTDLIDINTATKKNK